LTVRDFLPDLLCVVDDCTRECLALVAETSIPGLRVARELDLIIASHAKPRAIVSDNGTDSPTTVQCHRRRVLRTDGALEIAHTPEAWRTRDFALRPRYEGLVFERSVTERNAAARVLGVGHRYRLRPRSDDFIFGTTLRNDGTVLDP
jgi:hypothetical protein